MIFQSSDPSLAQPAPRRASSLMPLTIGLALAWTPLLYGGNDIVAWGVNATVFGALACITELSALRKGRAVPLRSLQGPALLFFGALGWAALQSIPVAPPGLRHPAWDAASAALGMELGGSISVDPMATQIGVVRLLTGACAFWVCLQAAAEERGARIIVWMMALAAMGYAIYGMAAFALTPGQVLGVDVPSARGVVTSTFISRNHYSTYAGLGVVLWVGLGLGALRAGSVNAPWRYRVARALERTFGEMVPYVGGALVCAIALLMTGSRAGILSTALGLVACLMARGGGRGVASHLWSAVAAVVTLAILGLVFGDVVLARLHRDGLADAGRLAAYAGELRAIWARPMLGFGYASFADVFPQFRTSDVGIWGVWDHAHNTYMDLVIGLGVLGGGALILAVSWLGVISLRGPRRRKNDVFSAISVGALVLVASHAVVDFSLEIQGVTLTFLAILAVGVARTLSGREKIAFAG